MRRLAWLSVALGFVLLFGLSFADDVLFPPKVVGKRVGAGFPLPRIPRSLRDGLKLQWPSDMPEYLGCRVDTVGYTYYDMQHNYTCGRNIALDDEGTVHICWMWSSNEMHDPRHIKYNYVTADGSQFSPYDGTQADGGTRGGYTNITLTRLPFWPDTTLIIQIPFIAFHENYTTLTGTHTDIVWDAARRLVEGSAGGFSGTESGMGNSMPPIAYSTSPEYEPYYPDLNSCPDSVDLEAIWPKVDADDEGHIYIVSTNYAGDTLCDVPIPDYVIFYAGYPSYDESGLINQYNWSVGPLLLDLQSAIDVDIDVDRNTGEIAVAFFSVYDTNSCEHYSPEGGVYYAWLQAMSLSYRKSTDGGVTWTERRQIIGPQPGSDGIWSPEELDTIYRWAIYFDTVGTDTFYFTKLDTFVVFYRSLWGTDISLGYDPSGNLHAVFTAKMYTPTNPDYPCSVSVYYGSVILHWDEASGQIHKVCPPRFGRADMLPGTEYSDADETVLRPSIAFDDEGNIYVVWQQAWPRHYAYLDSLQTFAPAHEGTLSADDVAEWDTLIANVLGDGFDASAGGVANYDIFGAVSTDGGVTWSPPVNISNTYSRGCDPGDCLCEYTISMAERVDDKMHIFAVLDKDAGSSLRDIGETVECPVIHIAVDTSVFFSYAFPAGVNEAKAGKPSRISVGAYPNPFNAATNVVWSLPASGDVNVEIVDVSGRVVRTLYKGFATSGSHSVVWDGKDDSGEAVPSGTYMCRVRCGDHTAAAKVVLIK